jgi:hypothetical protein
MANSTRRALLRGGGMAVGAATLVSLNLPEVARAESESANVFHVFAFQWKERTSEAQKDRATKEISAFQGIIPGLLQTHVGPNIFTGRQFMAGKMDMEVVVSRIESLCLDYQAYRHISEHFHGSERLPVLVAEYRKAHGIRISELFDEVSASLQSGVPESTLGHALIRAIDNATR